MAFTKKQILAVDFGTHAVKAMVLGIAGGRLEIHAKTCVPVDRAGQDRRSQTALQAEALEKCLSAVSAGGSARRLPLVSSLPPSRTFVKQVSMIPLPEEQRDKALYFEMQKHFPLAGNPVIDAHLLRRSESREELVVAIAERDAVVEHRDTLAAAGLEAGVIDIGQLALPNGYLLTGTAAAEEPVAFLQIGASHSQLVIRTASGDLFCRQIDIAGDYLTRQIAAKIQCGFDAAEEKKLSDGLARIADQDPRMSSTFETMLREIQRTIRFISNSAGTVTLNRMYLTGGSCADAWVCDSIASASSVPVELFDPFSALGDGCGITREERAVYGQVFCMALRKLHDLYPSKCGAALPGTQKGTGARTTCHTVNCSLNRLQDARKEQAGQKKTMVLYGCLVLLLLGVAAQSLTYALRLKTQRTRLHEAVGTLAQQIEALETSENYVSERDVNDLFELTNRRVFWADKLEAISRELDPNMALTELSFNHQGLIIKGIVQASDGTNRFPPISAFIDRLKGSQALMKDFSAIEFSSSDRTRFGGKDVMNFEVLCRQ
jgi:type IV pilus assembly protein PilM